MAQVNKNEVRLIEYMQEQAQNLVDFCERNDIKDFDHCGITFFKSTGNIKVDVSVRNGEDKLDHISGRWKLKGGWEDIEVTPYEER